MAAVRRCATMLVLCALTFEFVVMGAEVIDGSATKDRTLNGRRRQVATEPNGARRRRPSAGLKPGLDKSLVNETLGPSAVERNGKFLSLFTIVQFQNQGCAASSGDNGTCVTSAECSDRGGVASGPCANGYGVCCVFLATCGQNTKENCTYFVNQGYPGPYDGTGSCQLTINKAHPDICQFRLDFDQFSIAGPESIDHICNNDQFIVAGGNPTSAICGINTGNHMYIDAGVGNTNPVTLNFVTSGLSFPRNWKIKICQIPCNTIYRAEEGCLQYFTGVSGQIKSYNYDPAFGLQLSKQDYSICIRKERNFCGIQYAACPDTVNNRTHAFTLSGNTRGQTAVSSNTGTIGPNSCNEDWLIIPCATNVGRTELLACVDRICGGTLNTEISTTAATVFSTVKPFRLTVHTNNIEAPSDAGNRGFCLNYVQQPCSNNYEV
ncbi:hypothetical protein L798_10568 [Zootermopsis nevadensis]|uniref:CUB domain-containing protein n=2 Tax=Zootermopsis nevadensis TaxID=136037 RepID=A0A067QW23_ZOONE|nr:hypothetical protein L798_10568 [Zootermopsis nevadensis]